MYAQTYYRIIYLNDKPDSKFCYYRAGVLNNSLDRKTKKVSSDEEHFSASNLGAVKAAINLLIGRHVKEIGGLNPQKAEERLKGKNKDIGVAFSSDGLGKQRITDKYGTIGSVTDNHDKGERRYSFDSHKMAMHKTQATAVTRRLPRPRRKKRTRRTVKISLLSSIALTTRVITHPRTMSWDNI